MWVILSCSLSTDDCYYHAFIVHCFRENDNEETDIQDLVMCFSGLEEKVLEQYTFAKVNLRLLLEIRLKS